MTMEGFTVPEDVAARRLGIALDELRERRGEKGRDWAQQGRGHRVFWTEQAVQEMGARLGTAVLEADPGVGSENAPAPSGGVEDEEGHSTAPEAEKAGVALVPALPEVQEAVVTRLVQNHSIILARVTEKDGTAQEVTVRVGFGRAQCFVPKMRILVRCLGGTIYSFEGNPDQPTRSRKWPRWRGIW